MCEQSQISCNSDIICIAYFGSYLSEDYIEGISDINIFILLNNNSVRYKLLLDLASTTYCSPVILTKSELKEFCEQGEPLCYYILYDSKLICGSLPRLEFRITERTKNVLRNNIISYYTLGVNAILRNDEISELNNFYRAVRALIRFISVERSGIIPLRDKDIINYCKVQGLKDICELFELISNSRKNRLKLSNYVISKVTERLSEILKINFPNLSVINNKNIVGISYRNERFYVKYLDGKEEPL